MQFSLDRNRRRHKQNQCSASDSVDLFFTTSYRSTLLITTPTTTPSLVKTSLKWYCESSPVYFLWQYTFRDTKITFQLLFIPVLFMCDSSLRTHPSLLLSLLLLLLLQYYYYYYIIIMIIIIVIILLLLLLLLLFINAETRKKRTQHRFKRS